MSMAVSTRKQTGTTFKKDVGFQKNLNQSVAKSKSTLATGGGEPIKKGHKRTNERRVLQPRDPETGKFDYNSSANLSRKYDYHADRNGSHGGKGGGGVHKTVPYFARGLEATFAKTGVKKGDVISAKSQKYISTCDMTAEQFRNMLENYLEDDQGGGHLGNDANWMKLGGTNDRNKGAAQAGDNRVGSLEHFSKVVEERTKAYESDPEGKDMKFIQAADDGGLDPQTLAKNQAYNQKMSAAKAQPQPAQAQPAPSAPAAQPATPAAQPQDQAVTGSDGGVFNGFINSQKGQNQNQGQGLQSFFSQPPAQQPKSSKFGNLNKAGLVNFLKGKGF
jgi:hypothetical protein